MLRTDFMCARQKQEDQFGSCDNPGRDDGGLDQNVCIGGAKKWKDLGYNLEI